MITTTVTHAGGAYSNTSPITFSIVFSEVVTLFVIGDLNVTGGTVISLSGSGTTYSAVVSPTSQGSTVLAQVPAGVAQNGLAELNLASNISSVKYNSVKPRATITHTTKPVTNSQFIKTTITFDRAVTGFVPGSITTINSYVQAFSGSGTTYQVTIVPQAVGEISFYVDAGGATDLFGNACVESTPVRISFDPYPIDEKSDATYGTVSDPGILLDFEIEDIHQVSAIQSIADCAKDIPQRLLELAEQLAFDMILANPNVQQLVYLTDILASKIEVIQSIVDQVHAFIEEPETLLQALLDASGLTGEALRMKMQYIADTFSSVVGLDILIGVIQSTGICGQPNYFADGSFVPRQIITPTNMMPPPVPGISIPVIAKYDSTAKDNYDEFAFNLKEYLEFDSSEAQSPDRAAMISLVMTLAMGYHDDVVKTVDDSRDVDLYAKYKANVEYEKGRNLTWDQPLKDQFETRTLKCGEHINRNTSVIRAFMNRNSPITGTPISTGVTTYSGPDKDFTTFLDIKPSQRPPELTEYWSKKYNIAAQEAKLNNRGIKTGKLNYSDAYSGAYGTLVSDQTVASSRFPGGSVIALRKKDGTVYDPTSKNPSGHYTVTDTGNAKLTYAKPDIFTSTPELYAGSGAVDVFLISKGTKTGKQYLLAQQRYGSADSA